MGDRPKDLLETCHDINYRRQTDCCLWNKGTSISGIGFVWRHYFKSQKPNNATTMPRLEAIDAPDPIGSCDLPGCNQLFIIEEAAECKKCRRVFCSAHDAESCVLSNSSSDTSDSDSSHALELGCVLCCRSKRHADQRIFDDSQLVSYLLTKLQKTRTDVEGEMREEIAGGNNKKQKPKKKKTQLHPFPSNNNGELFNSLLTE